MGLTGNRQTALYLPLTVRKVFFIVNGQKCRLRLTVKKKFRGISDLTISEDFHGILAP